MNPKAKGNRNEKKAKDKLIELGWIVERVKNCGKFQKQVDFFGLFDLIAIKNGQVILIQVKTNRKPPFKKYAEFIREYCCNCGIQTLGVEVWVWFDRKGFKRYLIDSDGKHEIWEVK